MRVPIVLLLALLGGCDRQAQPSGQAERPAAAEPKGSAGAGVATVAVNFDESRKGQRPPADEFVGPAGPTTLAAFRGKPLIVNLWATWCPPCVRELPALDRLAETANGRLQVVAISQDRQGVDVTGWWRARGLTHLQPSLDPGMKMATALATPSLPTTILFDADGKEVWRVAGGLDWGSSEGRKLIEESL